jgi:hypothetical protein
MDYIGHLARTHLCSGLEDSPVAFFPEDAFLLNIDLPG